MKKKFLIVFALLILIAQLSYGQAPCIKQSGRFVYECPCSVIDSMIKINYSILGTIYIQKYYPNNRKPLVYICLDSNELDAIPRFELSYDNLKGNSVENQDYNRNRKYDKPGIRIKINSDKYQLLEFLKLLEFGITNLDKLKETSKRIKSIDYYSRPNSLSLSQEEIDYLLSQKLLHPIPDLHSFP